MEIRTKFNIGDKIFPIHIPLGKEIFMVMDKIEIKAITVIIDKNGIKIDYDFQWVRGLKYFNNHSFEEDCFATKEEAEKECEIRNTQIKRVLTCRYAFADILSYQCSKGQNTHKIIPIYDCKNCKDYSNKYFMTKEKLCNIRSKNNGK